MDSITFLRLPASSYWNSEENRYIHLRGRKLLDPTLTKVISGHAKGKRFIPVERPYTSVEALSMIAEEIQAGDCGLVHARVSEAGRAVLAKKGYVEARARPKIIKHSGKVLPGHLEDQPSRLLAIDFDGAELPWPFDPFAPEESVRQLITAAGLDGAAVLWQLTASQQPRAGAPVRLRFYCITDKGLRAPQRTRLLSIISQRITEKLGIDPRIDPAVARRVQFIYIAPPEIEGGVDLIPRRFGIIEGGEVAIDLDQLKGPAVPDRAARIAGRGGVRLRDIPEGEEILEYLLPNEQAALHPGMVNAAYHLRRMEPAEMVESIYEYVEGIIDWSAPKPRRTSREELRKEVEDIVGWAVSCTDEHIVRGIEPAFPVQEVVSPAEAELAAERAVLGGLQKPGRTIIRLPAGVGKTEQVLRALDLFGYRAHAFVPTHAQAEEMATRARMMGMTAQVMKGRETLNGAMEPLCKKLPAIQHLREQGFQAVSQYLCESPTKTSILEFVDDDGEVVEEVVESRSGGGEVCPYAQDCDYFTQHETDAQLVVFQHAHLAIPESTLVARMRKPDVVVIDEDPLKALHVKGKVPKARLPAALSPLAAGITDVEFYDLEAVRALRDRVDGVRPSMDAAQTLAAAQRTRPSVTLAAEMVATCIEQGHDDLPDVRVGAGVVEFSFVRKIARAGRHTILLDATLRPTIADAYFPNARIEEVRLDDNIDGYVVADRTFSKTAMKEERAYVGVADELPEQLRHHKTLGIVTSKAHADQLAAFDVLHYGALRGSDTLRKCDFGLVVGRMQPPLEEVVALARALFPGRPFRDARLVERAAGYRMADGTRKGVVDLYATCEGGDAELLGEVMGTLREDELLQGLGRFRAVRKPYRVPVMILGRLPVDVTVREVLKVSDVEEMNVMLAGLKAGDVFPLVPRLLVAAGVFKTEKTAERWLGRGRGEANARRLVELLAIRTESPIYERGSNVYRPADNALRRPAIDPRISDGDGRESTRAGEGVGGTPNIDPSWPMYRSRDGGRSVSGPAARATKPRTGPPDAPGTAPRAVLHPVPEPGEARVALVAFRLDHHHRRLPAGVRALALVNAVDLADADYQLGKFLRRVKVRDKVAGIWSAPPVLLAGPPEDDDPELPERPEPVPSSTHRLVKSV